MSATSDQHFEHSGSMKFDSAQRTRLVFWKKARTSRSIGKGLDTWCYLHLSRINLLQAFCLAGRHSTLRSFPPAGGYFDTKWSSWPDSSSPEMRAYNHGQYFVQLPIKTVINVEKSLEFHAMRVSIQQFAFCGFAVVGKPLTGSHSTNLGTLMMLSSVIECMLVRILLQLLAFLADSQVLTTPQNKVGPSPVIITCISSCRATKVTDCWGSLHIFWNGWVFLFLPSQESYASCLILHFRQRHIQTSDLVSDADEA